MASAQRNLHSFEGLGWCGWMLSSEPFWESSCYTDFGKNMPNIAKK